MPALEVFLLTIGTAVAKYMIRQWLGSDNWKTPVVQDLAVLARDTIRDRGKASPAETRVDQIAEQIVGEMKLWIDSELRTLPAEERTATIEETARTLNTARLTTETLLVTFKLDPERVYSYLATLRPDAKRGLSEMAAALYDRLLRESGRLIAQYAPDSPDFAGAMARAILLEQEQQQQGLTLLVERPSREDEDFRQRYLRAIIDRLDRAERFGLPKMDYISGRQRLSTAYIRLNLGYCFENDLAGYADRLAVQRDKLAHDIHLQQLMDWQDVNLAAEWRSHLTRNSKPRQSVQFLGLQSLRVVVRGKAGSGKTTLLQQLAMLLARAGLRQSGDNANIPVPFFIRLREHVDDGFPPPEDFVKASARMIAGNMPVGWVHRLLDSGQAIVLIDGLDEVPERKRGNMLHALQDLTRTYGFAAYMVTSRPAAIAGDKWPEWVEWTKASGFLTVEIPDMTPTQAEQLIDQWHVALAEAGLESAEDAQALGDALKRKLRMKPALRQLTLNPLLCAMLCAVHHARRENLPSERLRLYQDCVGVLLTQRELGRGIPAVGDYPPLSETQWERLAQSIAYWFLKNDYNEVPFEDAESHFEKVLPDLDVSGKLGEGVRRYFIERTSLLREPTAERVDFQHRTFLEYLAACAATFHEDYGVLLQNAGNDQWRETIILAIGQAPEPRAADFLKKLIAKADGLQDPRLQRPLYLLAAACLETIVALEPRVRKLVTERAAELLPPISSDDCELIAKVGAPIIALLKPNPDYSSEETANCIKVLSQVGTEAAQAGIVSFVDDRRSRVQEAIAAAWSSFERKGFRQQVLRHLRYLVLQELPTAEDLADLNHIENLVLRNIKNETLPRLAWPEALRFLTIEACHFADITALDTLTELRRLSLRGMQVNDIAVLRSLGNIEWLDLRGTGIEDLGPLTDAKALTSLWLDSPFVEDPSVLSTLRNLSDAAVNPRMLDYGRNLTPVRHVRSLAVASLQSDVLDLQSFSEITDLEQLHLLSIQASNIAQLSAVPKLTHLEFYRSPFDFRELADITTLKSLVFSGPNATHWEAIAGLLGLEELRIYGSEMPDLKPLASLPKLKHLEVVLSSFDSQSLAQLHGLESISLDAGLARDLSPLAGLPELRDIYVYGSGRIDRASLSHRQDLTIHRY